MGGDRSHLHLDSGAGPTTACMSQALGTAHQEECMSLPVTNFFKSYVLRDPICMPFWKNKTIKVFVFKKTRSVSGCQGLGTQGEFDYEGAEE